MAYAIFSQDGNLLDSFGSEYEAQVAMQQIVAAEPDSADSIAIVTMDASGMPTGEAVYPLPVDVPPVHVARLVGTVVGSFGSDTRPCAIGHADVVAVGEFAATHSYAWDDQQGGTPGNGGGVYST